MRNVTLKALGMLFRLLRSNVERFNVVFVVIETEKKIYGGSVPHYLGIVAYVN